MKTIALLLVMLGSFGTAVLLPGIGDLATADMGALTGVVLTDAFSWCAVPLYAWMLVNGFRRTHAAGWYPGQTGRAGGGVRGALRHGDVGAVLRYDLAESVWGLCIALIALMVLRAFQGRRDVASWAIRIAVLLAATLWAYLFNVGLRLGLVGEGLMTLVFAVIFYTLARRENTMMLTAARSAPACLSCRCWA